MAFVPSDGLSPAALSVYDLLELPTFSEVPIFGQQSPPPTYPSQDLMTDNRTNQSLLFLNDPVSPPYQQHYIPAAKITPPSVTFPPSPDYQVPPCSAQMPHQPFFSDLRRMIASECSSTSLIPSSLFQTMIPSWQQDVSSREMSILARFRRLESSAEHQVKELSRLFRHHSASIEIERVQMLSSGATQDYRDWLNNQFDQQRHQVMDRVEKSLRLLEDKTQLEKRDQDFTSGVRRRAPLSRRAIKLMEAWYQSHQDHPYPSATVTEALARSGDVTTEQVRKWFANKRIRNCNTRSLTEIAKRKHQAKFSIKSSSIACSLQYGQLYNTSETAEI